MRIAHATVATAPWIAVVALAAGCTSTTSPLMAGDVPPSDRPVGDMVVPDALADGQDGTGEAPVPGDADESGGGDGATDPQGDGVGPSCATGAECVSGVCVQVPGGGKQCAVACVETACPEGWECRSVVTGGSDVSLVCLPQVERLCRPCEWDEDCRPEGLDTGDLCVDRGAAGKFCGTDCSGGQPCPQWYSCQVVETSGGGRAGGAKQCVRLEADCPCTPAYEQAGYKTTCFRENPYGRCLGERRCSDQGLTDCDAAEPVPEVCDGQDQDCDGQTDNGIVAPECEKTFGDKVCKGPNVCEGGKMVCKAQDPGTEVCDGIDNDCNGTTDPEGAEGCVKHYRDADGDAYGIADDWRCLCKADGQYAALVPGDCDDAEAAVNPAAAESCNVRDDDCDGEQDEPDSQGCTEFFRDHDGDGYGVAGDQKCLCAPMGEYQATETGDCDDYNAAIHKGLSEYCNGADDDCNGVTDDAALDCTQYYYDNDNDGWGVGSNAKCLCAPEGKYTASNAGDCDDNNPAVSGGQPEVCDGKDNDCNGVTDDNATDCKTFWADKDGDGWGDDYDTACLCKPKPPYIVSKYGDCNDGDKTVNPAAAEKCNQVDDNCNGTPDEGAGGVGCQNWFYDGDQDGYAVTGNMKCLCQPDWESKYTTKQTGDCKDSDATVYPGAPEICDGQDNNCNTTVDEGEDGPSCRTFYYDGDSDGWGNDANTKCYCKGTGKYTTEKGGDCNDSSASIHPGASEVCNNQDDNCSGEPDETFACRTGQSQQEECTKCGTHSRSCANCNWGPWGTCMNQKACEKYATAACTDGCGTKTCSSSCDWGSCDFTKDPYEPNDTWNTATPQGTLKDGATTKTVSNATFHSNGDYDRFYVYVEESGSLFDWTMTLSATLSGVSGSHTMCLYYDRGCDGGVDHTKCGTQSGSLTVKTDDLDPNWGENNDGCIDIELYGAWSCSKYTLQLTLDP